MTTTANMEHYLTADVDKWIQSQVIEVEVSSEENPLSVKSSSFQLGQSQTGLLKKHPNKVKQFANSTIDNRVVLPVGNDHDKVKKSNLSLPSKKQKKSYLSEFETEYELDGRCGKYKCNRCQKYFTHKSNIINHLRNICGVEPKYVCPVCSFKTKSQITLKLHMRKFHSNDQVAEKISTLSQSFTKPGKSVEENHSNLSLGLLSLNSPSYQSKANFPAVQVNENQEQNFFNDLETSLSEQDSCSSSENGSQSEYEEEIKEDLLVEGTQEEESNNSDVEDVEQLKKITASLENKGNSESKVVVRPTSYNLSEPKKVIRFIDIDCASSSKYLNSYPDLSSNKISSINLAKRHQQSLKKQPHFSDIEVQFIKMETPVSDRLMEKFPERKRRKSKNENANSEEEQISKKRKKRDLSDIDGDFEFDEVLEKFKCKRCEKYLKSKVAIINHLRNICGIEPKHVCPFCSFKTKFAVCLKVHIAKLHCGTQPMEKCSKKTKSSKEKIKKNNTMTKKAQEKQYDSDTSQLSNIPLSSGEDSYGSEFEDEASKKPKKVELWKENEFVYDVKQDIFKCKSCNQIFKSKGVVALHRHVACSSTSFSTVE